MTIKELKELLNQYDEDMPIRVFDSNSGNIDITEVYQAEGTRAGTYVCIV